MSARALFTLLLALGALTLAACGGAEVPAPGTEPSPPATTEPPPPATTEPTTTTEPEPTGEKTVLLYFMRGDTLGVVSRAVPDVPDVARATIEALMSGPTTADLDAGLNTQIPTGTRVLGLIVADGLARVDLSGEFDDGGGSLTMFARLAQLVYTLTQFPTVQRVELRLDAQLVQVFSSEGIVLDHPQTREDYEDVTPRVLVESPTPGQTVTSPFRLAGTSNSFEATSNYELLDAAGQTLAEGFMTATCGNGCRGTFETSVEFEASPGSSGVLRVFEISAKDGSEFYSVEIPLVFG